MARRYALRDDQWQKIAGLLPRRDETVGVTAKDNRLFVDAVLYRYRAGIPWRALPERFGDGKHVQRRWSRWAVRGGWERVFTTLAVDANNEYAMIDSAIGRAHQHSAGAKGGPVAGSERALQRRADHQEPRHLRCPGEPDRLSSDPGTGQRPGRGGCVVACGCCRYRHCR